MTIPSSSPSFPNGLIRPPAFAVRPSRVHGRGVFACEPIRGGTRLMEYAGERISHEEAAVRYDDDSMAHHHTFLFTLDDQTCIDGRRCGNESRYLNHSCAPNCEAVEEEGGIVFIALRDIAAGEELTFDYNLERDEPLPRNWRVLYACHCGSQDCRRSMLNLEIAAVRKALQESA